jgi:hypothetical protein
MDDVSANVRAMTDETADSGWAIVDADSDLYRAATGFGETFASNLLTRTGLSATTPSPRRFCRRPNP